MDTEKFNIPLDLDEMPNPADSTPADASPAPAETVLPPEEAPAPMAFQVAIPSPVVATPARRKKPHIALRIFLQFFSFVFSILLTVALVGTVVVADINQMTSAGGIKQIIRAMLLPAPQNVHASAAGAGLKAHNLASSSGEASSNPLLNAVYQAVEQLLGPEADMELEKVQNFIEQSTVPDFLAEKMAGIADDLIEGTENTTITAEELTDLIEENRSLLETEFGVTITDEMIAELEDKADEWMESQNINQMIRDGIQNALAETPLGSSDEMMTLIRTVASEQTLYLCIGLCLALMLMLIALNFYNVPAGLTWISLPCMLMGALLSAPLLLLGQLSLPGEMQMAGNLLQSFAKVLGPIHYGLAILGVVLLILSIVWRIVRSSRQSSLRPMEA